MQTQPLGRTDIKTIPLMMGTMTFGSQVAEDEARKMVARCLDHGITLFDTANTYNDGRSEAMLGRLLKGRREQVQIATKVRYPPGDDSHSAGLGASEVRSAIEASLKRLQTDYVDLYYLHAPDPDTPIEETLAAMDELVTAGKVRWAGASNYAAWQLCEMDWLARQHGWERVAVAQQLYNLVNRRLEDEYEAFAGDYGLGTVVYNPLAGGLLTGKHRLDRVPQTEGRFSKEYYRERYWDREHFAAVARLQEIADQAGLTLLELAFRWLLSRPLVDGILLGASGLEQLEQNLAACSGPALDPEAGTACDAVWQQLRGAPIKYNR